jgi:hypothetical protein
VPDHDDGSSLIELRDPNSCLLASLLAGAARRGNADDRLVERDAEQ